jgi:drug/metabolite transporter (DMT)-like permease
MPRRHVVLALVVAVCWAVNFVVIDIGLDSFPPLLVAALRFGLVVSTFFGYGSWYWLMSRYPASTVAPFTLLVPVVGILTAWLVRGEHPTWGELLGSLVVLVGLGLALGARLGAATLLTMKGQFLGAAKAWWAKSRTQFRTD